ncbi:hypothetical protein HY449_03330 [Candidatus Pacearchaeota archaeon]|nr:hypothetical protein [Candidatus Pacearchaeota archaeon]
MKKICHKKVFIFLATLILFSSSVLAFAVSSQYYEGNPLYLQPGETRDVKIMLQNHAGTEDVSIKTEISEGKEIVELKDSNDIFLVPQGGKTDVYFKISAPFNAKKGDVFPVTLMFASSTVGGEDPIGLSGSIGKGFNVVIGEPSDFEAKEAKFSPKVIYGLIGVVLVVIAFLIARKKFSKKNKKTNKF